MKTYETVNETKRKKSLTNKNDNMYILAESKNSLVIQTIKPSKSRLSVYRVRK